MPVISITTPTFGRHKLLERQHAIVMAQSEQDFEWLILDDSPEPAAYFLSLADPRIRYFHSTTRVSIGAKRNWLAERAAAPVIAHFDDDDYYAPDYLKAMLAQLGRNGADLVKFSAWYIYSVRHRQFGYWDTNLTNGLAYRMTQDGVLPVIISEEEGTKFKNNYAGFGHTYVYRRSVWQDVRFPDAHFAEDQVFADAVIAAGCRFAHFRDTERLTLKVMRPDGLSIAWPQWLLPDFLLPQLFPAAALALLAD